MNQYLTSIRVDEFKYIFTAELEGGFFKKGHVGGFSGPIATETGGGVMVNLYTNPQEDVSIGIRHIPMMVPVANMAGWYMLELIKYPPQFKVEFLSNNPPAYDVLERVRQIMKKRGIPMPAP
jgi:arylsulfatase